MKHVITGLTILLLMVMTIPLQGQTGWGVDRYEGFRASVNNQGNISQIGWTTGNLGNAWDEGEWVPYCLSLKNVDMTVGASNFTPIRIKYDFTSANPAVRFVDLVRGVQVGVTGSIYFPLGSNTTGDYGWPSPAGPPLNGAPCPLTTASELTDAQNCQDANVWGGTAANAWKLLTLPQTQMNRDLTTSPLQYGGTGSPTDAEHCFTITYGDLTAAGISATYQGPMQIYFCLHLSQTFIWSLSLQDQLDVSPTDDWGGYLYSISPYDTDFRDGSGYVPGASGHTTLLGQGSRTVPIPIPPAPIGEISGLKYFDANANGVRDASESILEGWEIYISTSVGGTPISYTRVTDNTGAYSLTGLPGAVYTVSEKSQGLTPLASPPPNYPYAAFNQTPPSTWDESYPTTFSSINSGTVLGTATSTAGIALGYADVSWAVDLISTSIQGDVNFGNFIPPPECMVTASATSVCNDDPPVTLTAARIAEGTPPYTVSWSYSYAGSGTPSWTPPSSPTAFTFDYDPSTNPPGTYTFTAVLTDANGLPTPQPGCSATIVVHPLPTVSVSASPTAVCFGDPSTLTVTTNASSPTYLWDDPNASTTPSITVSPLTTTTYTVIVTDGTTGCDNSGSVTVTVNPLPVCSITPADPVCPNATTVHSAPAGMKEYLWGINGDGSIVGANNQQTVTVDAANICSGSYTLSLYIKDQNDCENNCSAAITVQDITPPTLTGTLPGGAQGNVCKSGAPGPPSEAIIEAEYSDDCGSQIIATFDPAQSGVTGDDCAWTATYVYKIKDICNNPAPDAVVKYTGGDTEDPVLSGVPNDVTIQCDESVPAPPTVTATDNCDPNPQVSMTETDTQDPDPTVCGHFSYTITRTWTATDVCSNSSSDFQTITVEDTKPPTFTRPSDITIYSDANCNYDAGVQYTGDVLDENDNCATGLQATFSDQTDASDPCNIVISRTWSLKDYCDNAAADQIQTITVKDNIPPTFTRPPDITIYRDANCGYDDDPSNTGDVTDEADNCGVGEATYADVVDNTDKCNVVITRTWSLVDNCGNAAADQVQTITVKDNTPPTFTRPADITIYRDVNCNYDAGIAFTGDVTDEDDNCDVGEATFADVVDNTDKCNVIITRTWSLIDDCGNAAADQIQTITVKDNIPPTFTRPPDITIYRDANCNYDASIAVTGDVTDEDDNCDVGEATYADVIDNSDPCDVIIARTWSLVDDCGNAAPDQVQTIHVIDNMAPIWLNSPPQSITVPCATDPIPFWEPVVNVDYKDNCDQNPTLDLVIVHDIIPQPDGTKWHIRSWRVIDACNLSSTTVTQTIVELRCQFASLTQGFYGNSGGTWCGNGASTINLLNSLLTTPLVVGILNTGSFTVGIGEGNCVIQALPPLGNAYALTKDYSFNPQCSATPGSPPIMTRGRFENNLLTQAITFGLNLRLDPNLITDLYLPPPTLPYLWTIDADYVNGICLDGNDIEAGLPKSFYIPPAVLTAMGSNGSNRGLSDLRDFANRAIAGLSISPATLTEVLDALDAFNKGFDGARFFAGYHPMAAPKSVVREKLPENFALHQNHPNPFNPSTTITFTIPQECNVRLAVYNALGEEIAVLLDRSVPAGTHAVTWNSNTARTNLPSGVYTYRIHAQVPDGVDFHDVKKMMLVK